MGGKNNKLLYWRRYKYAAFIFGQAQKQRQTAEEF